MYCNACISMKHICSSKWARDETRGGEGGEKREEGREWDRERERLGERETKTKTKTDRNRDERLKKIRE